MVTLDVPRTSTGFAGTLARHGDRPALVQDGRTISYADLADRVRETSAGLGTTPRLVALRPDPTIAFLTAYLAALAAGHPVLLTDDDALATAYGAAVVHDTATGRWRDTGATSPDVHPDLALLLSTSGSTGSPKLVRLSAANLSANATAIADYLGLTPDDVAITTLPLDYCYGLSVLHSHLTVGATVVLTDRSVTDPALWRLARRHGVTSFAGVPYTFDLLATTGWPTLPTLRQVTQAGGRMAPDRVQALARQGREDGWELVVMYGQTEATARIAYLPPELAEEHPGAIGVPIPGGSLRLDQTAGTAPGVGELVYSGPNVMMGYATTPGDLGRDAELTELRTGDLARRTDAGLYEIVGRRSRVAKVFGQRIDLDRAEQLLAVQGYDVAFAESADRADRLVVAVPGSPDEHGVDAVSAAAVEATGVPRHAIRAVPLDALPRRTNGKPDHAAIARLAATAERPVRRFRGSGLGGSLRTSTTGSGPRATTPLESVRAQYATVLGRDAVADDDTFVSLGGDSLSYVELSVRLEPRLRRLPSEWPTHSIAELAALHVPVGAPDRRLLRRLDTTIALRAIAIVLIVGSHTNLFAVAGGAHVLLAVAGFNVARFLLHGADAPQRRRGLLRATTRIAVPAVIWLAAVAVVLGDLGWRNVLLLNDALGSHRWQEPEWHYWFLEVLVYLVLATAVLTSLPRVSAWERRAPYGFAVGLLALTLVPRFWATATGYDGDLIHSSVFVAWLFAGGWAAARADTAWQRLLVTVLLLAGIHGFVADDLQRELVIATGVLALVWLPSVPWPRLLVGATGVIASSSLYVYLTHWQVYPHLEDRWPLGGLLASLAVGVLTWLVVDRGTSALRRRGREVSGPSASAAAPGCPAPAPRACPPRRRR
jgi:acyl-CoA synthetase (AMP-forming)/AMP-acid ligase II